LPGKNIYNVFENGYFFWGGVVCFFFFGYRHRRRENAEETHQHIVSKEKEE
jgi:hypothetical protein